MTCMSMCVEDKTLKCSIVFTGDIIDETQRVPRVKRACVNSVVEIGRILAPELLVPSFDDACSAPDEDLEQASSTWGLGF
jgi:hypothetical protein